MSDHAEEITNLLRQWSEGNTQAENELFGLVNGDLRRLARYLLRGERKGHSMQATELVDHIYFRLVAAKNRDWQSRQHFFAIAARAMRHHLIDQARGRPDAEFVGLQKAQANIPAGTSNLSFVMTVDKLLDLLAKEQPEWCRLIEMKYFLGLTDEEVAQAMGLKLRTLQRMWKDARGWLYTHLSSAEKKAQTAGSGASH